MNSVVQDHKIFDLRSMSSNHVSIKDQDLITSSLCSGHHRRTLTVSGSHAALPVVLEQGRLGGDPERRHRLHRSAAAAALERGGRHRRRRRGRGLSLLLLQVLLDKYGKIWHELNSVNAKKYQSLLPQPTVGQFGLIEMGWLTERWRSLAATEWTSTIGFGTYSFR